MQADFELCVGHCVLVSFCHCVIVMGVQVDTEASGMYSTLLEYFCTVLGVLIYCLDRAWDTYGYGVLRLASGVCGMWYVVGDMWYRVWGSSREALAAGGVGSVDRLESRNRRLAAWRRTTRFSWGLS